VVSFPWVLAYFDRAWLRQLRDFPPQFVLLDSRGGRRALYRPLIFQKKSHWPVDFVLVYSTME
jgi:hypothetical protein